MTSFILRHFDRLGAAVDHYPITVIFGGSIPFTIIGIALGAVLL